MQRSVCLILIVLSLWPVTGLAQVFKCVAANGELTFSQTPCPEEDSKVTVQKTVTSSSSEPDACQYAHRFALATAEEMQAGTSSAAVFDRYGGLSALSRGSVSLISYVFQYRTNKDVSAERVAALSVAKCRARSFGDVGCEELPVAFTSRLGGCELGEDSTGPGGLPFVSTVPAAGYAEQEASPNSQQAQIREARALEEQRRNECRDRLRGQIDSVNSQMRSGYSGSQGQTMRDRRRDLEERLRDC